MARIHHHLMMAVSLIAVSFTFSQNAIAGYPDFSPVIDKAGKSVVNVITTKEEATKLVPDNVRQDLEGTPLMDLLKQMYGDRLEEKLSGKGPSLGSGSIISEDGYIVTNFHVVEGASKIVIRLQDRREYPATLVGSDNGTDLALLKIDADRLAYLPYAATNATKVGQWVIAIGAPFGFENSVTVGVVSALGRSLGQERYVPFLQTDAAINPGNSGGPLLNENGELVGINSQIVSESGNYAGLSFAVPADVVKNVVEQLKARGSVARGWLGLAFQDLDRGLADSFGIKTAKGALISKVLPNSPAAKVGIKEGDVITEFNGREIIKATDLPPIVGLIPINSKVPMTVIRDHKEMKVSILLSKYTQQEGAAQAEGKKVSVGNKMDELQKGITVRELEDYEQSALSKDQTGVAVVYADAKPWATSGLRRGDIIVSVNSKKIDSAKDFYQLMREANKDKSIPLLVVRPGEMQHYIAVKF
ncbi:Do family serine endopeptidase [Candidatus Berkiella aquae]|uniref:Probable periplasmic serine endoprotease DegP-like n=1 Tax=Candidatus Berkiella aquae TaxID=295108 RepID=A0A0Q9YKM8_9GAMM|nr:Do family serine endopeptidase [Candidatus Berkiella aquae]MCS5711081.1 Do family serine endopeptidase [Candidatus Berkiella aquae]